LNRVSHQVDLPHPVRSQVGEKVRTQLWALFKFG
jgi:hypothetical protein